MSKISVGEFLTLDGVMQAPGGAEEDTEGGFTHGGWQMPFFDADCGRIMDGQMTAMDALLLGRRTYQIFAGYWPSAGANEPYAAKLNAVPKYVASNTLTRVDWNNSILLRGNVPEHVARLKQQSSPRVLSVIGSGKLAQTLLQHNLVDELILWVHPIVLGSGKRLFADGLNRLNLKLVDTRTTRSGVIISTYQPLG